MRKTIVNRYGNKQGGIKELNDNYRVVQVHRDRYLVRNEEKELYCTLTGNLRYREEFPVVDDDVEIVENPYGDSLILEIRPRRTVFCRPVRFFRLHTPQRVGLRGPGSPGERSAFRRKMEDVQPAGERKPMEQDSEEREDDEHCHGTAQEEHGAPKVRKGD